MGFYYYYFLLSHFLINSCEIYHGKVNMSIIQSRQHLKYPIQVHQSIKIFYNLNYLQNYYQYYYFHYIDFIIIISFLFHFFLLN